MEPTFVSIPGFDGKYEISITEPHEVIDTTTGLVLDEWYNCAGEEAVSVSYTHLTLPTN